MLFSLVACTPAAQQPVEKEGGQAPFISLSTSISPTLSQGSKDFLIEVFPDAPPQEQAMIDSVYSNRLLRHGAGFATASPDGVLAIDAVGGTKHLLSSNASSVLTDAASSPKASVSAFAFNIGSSVEPEQHNIMIVDGSAVHEVLSHSFPMGLTACDDGRVFWVDAPLKNAQRVPELARFTPSGNTDRYPLSPDVPLAGLDSIIDCQSENASFTVFDPEGSIELVAVRDSFGENPAVARKKFDPQAIETIPQGYGRYDGELFTVDRAGHIHVRKGFVHPSIEIHSLPLDGEQVIAVTYDGPRLLILHAPSQDISSTSITEVHLKSPKIPISTVKVSLYDEDLRSLIRGTEDEEMLTSFFFSTTQRE